MTKTPPVIEWVDEYGRLHLKVKCPIPTCACEAELVVAQRHRQTPEIVNPRRVLLEKSYQSHLGQNH